MFIPRETGEVRDASGKVFDVPEFIADHRLLHSIGQGSYGRVYLAQNQLTGVYRALKIVFREAFSDSRPYLREFDAICRFEPVSRSHRGFVQILHVGKLEKAFYYIMELADDLTSGPITNPDAYNPRTLGLSRGQMLPIEQCVEIGSRLADCLAVLHDHNLIHRDIKPSNIIFVDGKPKLADIGLVTQIDEAKSFVGTAGFMPPEGPITPASDIYSLGKVLYEIATGKDRCEFPQLPSDITAENALHLELNQIVLRACDPDPARRYKSAQEMRRELDLLHAGKSIKRLRQVEKRLRFFKMAFAASVLVGIASFLIYYQVKSRRERFERERQKQALQLLAEGTRQMRIGNLAHALPYFVHAAEYDPDNIRSHQLRIGSVFAHAPNLAHKWTSSRLADISADGRRLVAPEGNSLVIFDTISGQPIQTNLLENSVTLAKFSPDSSRVGAAHGSTLLVLGANGEQIARYNFETNISDLAFTHAHSRAAVALSNGSAFFFNYDTGSAQPLPGNVPVSNLSFGPDDTRMLTSHVDKDLAHIRDALSGQILSPPLKTDMPYRGIFSPGGSNVILCGWATATPFKVGTGELAGDTMDNDDAVADAAFSPSGTVLATANFDGTVRFWDAETFDPLPLNHILEHESRPERLAFIDETTLLVHCNDGQNFIWNLGTRPPKPVQIARVKRPDILNIRGEQVSLTASDQKISGKIGETEIHVQFPNPVDVLAVSPKLDAFAAGAKDIKFDITYALLYRLDDLSNPIRLNHRDGINYLTFSHSGEKLVTCSEDFSAILWDARDGRRLTQPMRHTWQVTWADFTANDEWIVTAGWDEVCIVWSVATGEPLTTPLKFPEWLTYVSFQPGENGIIAGGGTNDYRMDLPFAPLPLKAHDQYLASPIELPAIKP